jgi:hypothetical protein
MVDQVRLKLTHLHCFDEGDGAGDAEPYLWTLFFKIDANTLERGEVTVTPGNHGNLNDIDVDAGDTIPIPPIIGEYVTNVIPIFQLPAIIGCLVLLLEEDNTPNSAISAGHDRLNAAFRTELARIIQQKTAQLLGNGGGNLTELFTEAELNDLKARISTDVTAAITANVSAWDILSGAGDMDDIIGSQLFIFTAQQVKDAGSSLGFSKRWSPADGSEDGDYEIRGVISVAPVIQEDAPGALAPQETPSETMYFYDGTERMYVFYRATDGTLRVNIWSGATWDWANQGQPQQSKLKGSPSALQAVYNTLRGARLYAFVAGEDGHLYENYWDGSQWRWTDHGVPSNTLLATSPSAIAYWREPFGELSETFQRMQVFCVSENGNLFSRQWNGSEWQWLAHQKPAAAVRGRPGVATMRYGGSQRVYAFVRVDGGGLAERYWDGQSWHWTEHGTPPGTTVASDPCMVQTRIGGTERLYAFFVSAKGKLGVRFWDGGQWQWGDLGTPSASITGKATATAYWLGNQSRINVFVRSTNGQLQEVYWDGSRWQWSVRGGPGNIPLDSDPDVVRWQLAGARRLNVFVVGHNRHAYSNWWDGSQWNWSHQGT